MVYKEVEGIDENGNPTTFKIEIPSAKQALKEIHELVTYPITESSIVKIKDNIAIIEKEILTKTEKEQAFEIIKNKGVFVHLLQQSRNVEEYNSLMLIAFKTMAKSDYKGTVEKFCLTQEEYDKIRKEVC